MKIEEYLNTETFYETKIEYDRDPTQGDIMIPYKGEIYEGPAEKLIGKNILGIIIVTNACDIENNSAKYIVYVPIYKAEKINKAIEENKLDSWKRIIKLNHPYLYYIPPHPRIDPDFGGVIYYQNIRSEKKSFFLKKYPNPTLTLKRPYIDRLCLKIAWFFNRIPINHPEDNEIENWIKNCLEIKIDNLKD